MSCIPVLDRPVYGDKIRICVRDMISHKVYTVKSNKDGIIMCHGWPFAVRDYVPVGKRDYRKTGK
jgi:hypothetical protein